MDKEVIEKVLKFRDDRNWKQFHNGKDLAISMSLEVNELLEIFQWSGNDLFCEDKIEEIKEELADVLIYSVLLADRYNLDIKDIILKKLEKNNIKYPLEKSKDKKDKYDQL